MPGFDYREDDMEPAEIVDALESGETILSIDQDEDGLHSMTAVYDSFAYRVEADGDGFKGYNIAELDLGIGASIAARLGWELANLKQLLRGEGRDSYELSPSEIAYSVEVQDLERTYPGADLTEHPASVYQDPAATFHADGEAETRVVLEDDDLADTLDDLR